MSVQEPTPEVSEPEVTDPKIPVALRGPLQSLKRFVSNEYVHYTATIGALWIGSGLLVSIAMAAMLAQSDVMSTLHDPITSFDCAAACTKVIGAGAACQRIGEQAIQIEGRIQFYYLALRYYSAAQFAFVVVGYTMGILSALLGVAVSRSGWGDCDKRLLVAFGAAASAFAFYEGVPSLVKFQSNVSQNSDTFLMYDDLLDEVRTYCTVGASKDGLEDPAQFALYVDSQMALLNELYFDLDEAQMSSGGAKFIESQNMDKYKAGATPEGPSAEPQ